MSDEEQKQEWVARLDTAEERLRRHAQGAKPSGLTDADPETGERWEAGEVWAHIAEFVPYWTAEALRMMERPSEAWGRDHTDRARLAAVTDTARCRLDDVVAEIRVAVKQAADTLRTLTDADLAVEAPSANPRWGVKPASFVIDQLLVHHVESHLKQIRRNVTQFYESGGARSTIMSSGAR